MRRGVTEKKRANTAITTISDKEKQNNKAPFKSSTRKYSLNVSTGSNARGIFENLIKENKSWNLTLKEDCDVIIPHTKLVMQISPRRN